MAYIHRAAMFCRAKCYRQAAIDAQAAVSYFQSSCTMASAHKPGRGDPDALTATHVHHPGTTSPFRRARIDPLAWSWCDAARWHSLPCAVLRGCVPGSCLAKHILPNQTIQPATWLLLLSTTCRRSTLMRSTQITACATQMPAAHFMTPSSHALQSRYISRREALPRGSGLWICPWDQHIDALLRCAFLRRVFCDLAGLSCAEVASAQAQVTDFLVAVRDLFRVAVATAAGVEKNKASSGFYGVRMFSLLQLGRS